jgi:hypothetical protein
MKLVKIIPVVLLVYKTFEMMSRTDWWKEKLQAFKYKFHLN